MHNIGAGGSSTKGGGRGVIKQGWVICIELHQGTYLSIVLMTLINIGIKEGRVDKW